MRNVFVDGLPFPVSVPDPPAPTLPTEPPAPQETPQPSDQYEDELVLTRGGLLTRLSGGVQAAIAAGATFIGGRIIPAPPRTTEDVPPPDKPTGAASVNWLFVRRAAEYPGNHPDWDMMRHIGLNGVAYMTDDPDVVGAAGATHGAGFYVALWGRPSALADLNAWMDSVQALADQIGADALLLDVETEAKGPPGSDAYNASIAIAQAAHAHLHTWWAVTPVRSDANDFDFTAYTDNGGEVIIQTYGENPQTDLFDPVEVVKLALAAGVPPNMISVVISPAQIATAPAALRALGITNISVYTTDGLTPGVVANATPFPASTPFPTSDPPDLPTNDSPEPPPITDEEIPLDNVDTFDFSVDLSVSVDEPTYIDKGTRSLSGLTGSRSAHFPSWCRISRGGYAQGVSGPISTGLKQFEQIVGPGTVHDDYATHGHATHSNHYCGLAADVDPSRFIWDLLWPMRSHLLELFGPWGLYDNGKNFLDPPLQAAHRNHIHVAMNLLPGEVRKLMGGVRGAGSVPPATVVPRPTPVSDKYHPRDVINNWHDLVNVFRIDVPKERSKVAAVNAEIRKVFG